MSKKELFYISMLMVSMTGWLDSPNSEEITIVDGNPAEKVAENEHSRESSFLFSEKNFGIGDHYFLLQMPAFRPVVFSKKTEKN
jgi:hypothetical protein